MENGDTPAEARATIGYSEARSRGLASYYTGHPCKNGHIAPRNTASRTCKTCVSEKSKTIYRDHIQCYLQDNPQINAGAVKRYLQTHPEKRQETARKSRQKHIEARKAYKAEYTKRLIKKIRATDAIYRMNNKDKVRAAKLAWRRANPDKITAIVRRYRRLRRNQLAAASKSRYHANIQISRQMGRINVARRRARIAVSSENFTRQDVERILRSQRNRCAACRKPLRGVYHIDHIKPLARGGGNEAKNIQCLCPTCNLRKSARDPLEFMQSLGRLL